MEILLLIQKSIQMGCSVVYPEIKGSMTKLGGIVKGIGKAIITAFAIKQIVQFGKECLELGSDLAEA
ncbi:MAG: hypothetical protein ACLTBV_29735, partial [Enterocloster bolteae]